MPIGSAGQPRISGSGEGGIALHLGCRDRRFEPCLPDHFARVGVWLHRELVYLPDSKSVALWVRVPPRLPLSFTDVLTSEGFGLGVAIGTYSP